MRDGAMKNHLAFSLIQSSFAFMVSLRSPASRLAQEETAGAGAVAEGSLDRALRPSVLPAWVSEPVPGSISGPESGSTAGEGAPAGRSPPGVGPRMAQDERNRAAR